MLERLAFVAIGSTNPVKLAAVRAVLQSAGASCESITISVDSGVPPQPFGDDQTVTGATTRADNALKATHADLAIGLEGGVVELPNGQLRTCAWAVAIDRSGRRGIGGSLAMPLPSSVAALIRQGKELGFAMDEVAQSVGTKHGKGAVGILTKGLIDRQRAYESLVTYALAPWLAPDYFDESGL